MSVLTCCEIPLVEAQREGPDIRGLLAAIRSRVTSPGADPSGSSGVRQTDDVHPRHPIVRILLHDKTAVFDQETIWVESVNWIGNGMVNRDTIFAFRDPDTNIIKTTMEEHVASFLPMRLEHFQGLLRPHIPCTDCAERLVEYSNNQAVLALEKLKRRGKQLAHEEKK